jgi:phosphopantothenoylcysteine decarboxylase/phosphopantothenate--cysteine ligase
MRSSNLKNRNILLAVTGGIAVYKAAELASRFRSEGASVTVLMTEASKEFISPLTFESLTGNEVLTGIFSSHPMSHINLSDKADLFVIAPATANTISRIAAGLADDIVTLSLLAFRGPVIFAPAMNWKMYENPVVRRNIRGLRDLGFLEVVPETGRLACGESGIGRMAPVERIVETARSCLCKQDLSGLKILVTAGPTREYIDPIRFISNRSSGKMGYSIAKIARRRGAEVTLVSGPTSLAKPYGIEFIEVETSEDMAEAVRNRVKDKDILVMAAAVADFTPECFSPVKRDKKDILDLKLRPTVDIIRTISEMEERPLIIGFSAETGRDLSRPGKKLIEKGMDIIVFNDVTEEGAGFDHDTNRISIIDRNGTVELPMMSKEECAEKIFDHYLKIRDE